MGRARDKAKSLPCGMCGASGYDPCIHRTTGKPLKSFHHVRRTEGRNDVLNRQVAQIEKQEDAERFFMFAWIVFGLKQNQYPTYIPLEEWQELYKEHPDYDPGNQYRGEW
jgi:hypothetical protein